MTTNGTEIVAALRQLLGENPDGLAVQELQEMLYDKFKLKVSYRNIEQTLIHNSELFSERDWKWLLRREH
ncbi:MAG: hypothetical protein PHE50_10625 [Dehalococcoidales bacterium]|nr:hypothetical protein [Dehalococcoidales bacterium]